MPASKEILLTTLTDLKEKREGALSPFQISCLDKFTNLIKVIPEDKKTEMDLRICGYLLDFCFCYLEQRLGSDHSIMGLFRQDLTNEEFYERSTQIFQNEIKHLSQFKSDSFFDQSFKIIKNFIVEMKNEMDQLKIAVDKKAIELGLPKEEPGPSVNNLK